MDKVIIDIDAYRHDAKRKVSVDMKIIKKWYESYLDCCQEKSCTDLKKIFIIEEIFNLTTYDSDVSKFFYDKYLFCIKAWLARTLNSDYYDNKTITYKASEFSWDVNDKKYLDYLTFANMMDEDFIDWGTSIRTAWWDNKKVPITYMDINDDYDEVTLTAELMLDIINWVEE